MSKDHLQKNTRMRPGVKALIVYKGKILLVHELVQRISGPIKIKDFPGGGVEFGENLKEALIREVKEEVGLNIEVGKVVGAWDFVLNGKEQNNFTGGGVHIVCIGYQCKVLGNINIDVTKNPADENIYDTKWYTREELLANNGEILKHNDMLEAIKNLNI